MCANLPLAEAVGTLHTEVEPYTSQRSLYKRKGPTLTCCMQGQPIEETFAGRRRRSLLHEQRTLKT
jgi:hypothetical protein